MERGADLSNCMVIEIFCGAGRVAAQLKRYGLGNSFGTDHVKHKQAAAQIVLADLTTKQGVDLLFQWLSNEYVVGVFLAPPCGSASRARSIRLKRKHGQPLPKPFRSDRYPNGLNGLPFTDRIKISKANKLYHLTARIVEWAMDVGVIFCIENPQFSHFWNTTFMRDIWHLLDFTVFHTCQYGGQRLKRTMLAFNAPEFKALCKLCPGVSKKRKHAKWGIDKATQRFATSLETAYPMVLAQRIAAQFVLALKRLGIKIAPELMADVTTTDNNFLPALRSETGFQPRASQLPPLIPTFASRVALTGRRKFN